MWKCSNCHHVELARERPERCRLCGAEKLVRHQVPRIKGTKTLKNLKAGFIAESQAHQRNRWPALLFGPIDTNRFERLC